MRRLTCLTIVLLAGFLGACATSSYQSARMLAPGGTRLTAALSNYEGNADEGGSGETAFEIMGSHGLSDRFEIGGKLSYMDVGVLNESQSIFTILAQPKFSLTPDALALTMPTGVIITDDDHAYEIAPGVVWTKVLRPEVELDVAGNFIFTENSDLDDNEVYIGANVGAAFAPANAPWAIHPEVGLVFPTGDSADTVDYFLQFGLAFHYRFGPRGAAVGNSM